MDDPKKNVSANKEPKPKKRILRFVSAALLFIAVGAGCFFFGRMSADKGINEKSDTKSESTTETTETPSKAPEKSSKETPEPQVSEKTEPTETPEKENETPFEAHGKLSVSGAGLVDRNGDPYTLRGVSTHGLAWFPDYVNKAAFATLRDDWGASCVRLAMYTAEYNGYCAGGDKDELKKLVRSGVQYATELGMYVIVDWHILSDNDPMINKDEAVKFFDEMSGTYADSDNVIYEICNEPNGGTSWEQIKAYAEEVIPVIRKNSPDAIIVVGTPTWSQDVDKAAADPIKGYDNIMYTIHFYAATHKGDLRKRMLDAVSSGIAVFCTEFGTCDASGNGGNDFDEAGKWIEAMEDAGISYCIWNLSNKDETSAQIASSCDKISDWKENDLSASGKWYRALLRSRSSGVLAPDTDADDGGKDADDKEEGSDNGDGILSPVKVSGGSLEAELKKTGGWQEGNNYYYQFSVTVRNTGEEEAAGWKVTAFPDVTCEIVNSWNGVFGIKDGVVSIEPVGYNSTIDSGKSAEAGFILSCGEEIKRVSLKVE